MSKCVKRFDVAAMLLGALTPDEEAETMSHISGCANCQATLAEFLRLPDRLAQVPVSMLDLIDRVARIPATPVRGSS